MAIRQLEPALAMKPLCSAGISPSAPATTCRCPTCRRRRQPWVRSRMSSSSTSSSRPKNRWSSSASNGRSPGNGLARPACLQPRQERRRARPAPRRPIAAPPSRRASGSAPSPRSAAPIRQTPDRRPRLRPAVARRFLQLAQLALQPQLVGRAVENQHAVADAQVLFVILANLGLVAVEDRPDHLDAALEQRVGPRVNRPPRRADRRSDTRTRHRRRRRRRRRRLGFLRAHQAFHHFRPQFLEDRLRGNRRPSRRANPSRCVR